MKNTIGQLHTYTSKIDMYFPILMSPFRIVARRAMQKVFMKIVLYCIAVNLDI